MGDRFRIEPEAVYDDAALVLGLGVTYAALARSRRAGTLRASRKGRRTLYRGQWVLDWLDAGGDGTAEERRAVRDRGRGLFEAAA